MAAPLILQVSDFVAVFNQTLEYAYPSVIIEGELADFLGGIPDGAGQALWLASGGLPGPARTLAVELAGLGADADPVVHLALHAPSRAEFRTRRTNSAASTSASARSSIGVVPA